MVGGRLLKPKEPRSFSFEGYKRYSAMGILGKESVRKLILLMEEGTAMGSSQPGHVSWHERIPIRRLKWKHMDGVQAVR